MKLSKFRVTQFRSVIDSGWIDASDVTALIGTNESGKTNLLLPLWKLNPASESEGLIDPIRDYPRSEFNEIREAKTKPIFIEAVYDVPPSLATSLSAITNFPVAQLSTVSISRDFDGRYFVGFPDAAIERTLDKAIVAKIVQDAIDELSSLQPLVSEETFRAQLIVRLNTTVTNLSEKIGDKELEKIITAIADSVPEKPAKTSTIVPRVARLNDSLTERLQYLRRSEPSDSQEAIDAVLAAMPKFVYYSHYGNLDSEIYLPHVIDNFARKDLGPRDAARARTLRVLFEFVNLKPEEIRDLGADLPAGTKHSQDEIEKVANKKKEREILLQSAATKLTKEFRNWWKQGEYIFDLQADGNHFRIWVSDDLRPEKVELEGRSTGLQWFLSFFLVFLVESKGSHAGAIILLDEPGLSLHPLAQEDLSTFFDSLGSTNQLIYTTHSPFLVDADRLDRVKAVYVDKKGATAVSSDLRAGEREHAQKNSIYPVHAALGLSISAVLFQGCQLIVVEGTSDQHYLGAIKTFLIAKKLIAPKRELVFIPGKGARSIKTIASILSGSASDLPYIILDSDPEGQNVEKELNKDLYRGEHQKILMIEKFTNIPLSEVEDLLPGKLLADVASKMLKGPEEDFSGVYQEGKPIVPQIENFIDEHEIEVNDGWKVELARKAKLLLVNKVDSLSESEPTVLAWQSLFQALLGEASLQSLQVVGA